MKSLLRVQALVAMALAIPVVASAQYDAYLLIWDGTGSTEVFAIDDPVQDPLQVSRVSTLGQRVLGSAVDPAQRLHVVLGSDVFRLDPGSWRLNHVVGLAVPVDDEFSDIAFDDSGRLWLANETLLSRVDMNSGAITEVVDLGFGVRTLTAHQGLLFAGGERLARVHPQTGATEELATFGSQTECHDSVEGLSSDGTRLWGVVRTWCLWGTPAGDLRTLDEGQFHVRGPQIPVSGEWNAERTSDLEFVRHQPASVPVLGSAGAVAFTVLLLAAGVVLMGFSGRREVPGRGLY